VKRVESSFFGDKGIFAADQIQFDHALLMRDIQHEWPSEPEMVGKQ